MARTIGATSEQTSERVELTAEMLLADKLSAFQIRKQLEELYSVSPKTAKRYVAEAEELNRVRFTVYDSREALGVAIEKIRRNARECREAGELVAAASLDKAILSALALTSRADTFNAARLHGKGEGYVEPSDKDLKPYRRSINDLPPDYPH